MARTLVDSDILIDVLRGAAGAADRLAGHASVSLLATSTVTFFEVLRGATTVEARERFLQIVREFEVLSLDEAAASESARVFIELRRAGTPIDTGDLLIAGVALAQGLPLLTRNVRDFGRIAGLELVPN